MILFKRGKYQLKALAHFPELFALWRMKLKISSNNSFGIYSGVASLLLLWALAVVAAPQSSRGPQDMSDSIFGNGIVKGIESDGKLWLRGADLSQKGGPGGLISINLVDDSRVVHFQGDVVDIEVSGGDLLVLRHRSSEFRELVVSAWRGGEFDDLISFTTRYREVPIALLNVGDALAVLSTGTLRIKSRAHNDWRVVKLKDHLPWGVQISAASPTSGKRIYIGANQGEWGGGIRAVDVETGAVTNIERRDSQKLCSGPLNSECDPVTAVISDPQNSDCVLASVGLYHMWISGGRILRVCGGRVIPVFEKQAIGGIGGKMQMTEAFYGLAAAGDGGFWAISWRALYHFAADGRQDKEFPLPNLTQVSGVYLTRDLPGAIVVSTSVNRAVSTSGYTPLLIPLVASQARGGASR